MNGDQVDQSIVTPAGKAGFAEKLGRGEWAPGLAARLAVRFLGRPRRFGARVFAARYAHVRELLDRNREFLIAPINAVKIDEVNDGPFILGMDHSEQLDRERGALYAALGVVDLEALKQGVAAEIERVLAAVPAGGEIDIVSGYARDVAAHTAQRLFGITGPNDTMFKEVVRSIFAHTFLNLGNDPVIRDRAIRAGAYMCRWFAEEIARRRASGEFGTDMMGELMRQGKLDDDGIRRTLGGMLVGSIDTTASCVAKVMKVAWRDPELLRAMTRDAGDLDRMDGWCNEALRRWPHNPIVMRRAAADTMLAGSAVRKGDLMIAWTQAAMQDRRAFPDPKTMNPERDLNSYMHLGWGLHLCSGKPINRFQIPMLVAALLRRGVEHVGEVEWTGPFPNRIMARLRDAQG